MTHILAKWRPTLDKSAFVQGDITDPVWRNFLEFIECCHAAVHWANESRESKKYANSKTLGLKRWDLEKWKTEAKNQEKLHYAAKFRAAELTFEMKKLASSEADTFLVDDIFGVTQLSPKNTVTGHEHARFDLYKIDEFPAARSTPCDDGS